MSKTLTDAQIKTAAETAGLEYALLKAVAVVESSGSGFLADGQPKILFEGHVFWRELVKRGLDPNRLLEGNENILHKAWTRSYYLGGKGEHLRLQQAAAIDREAALSSASWGLFQIMGFNWKVCGFQSLQQFINAMYRDEAAHLGAALGFLRGAGLMAALKRQDWAAFARGYNGPGYAANQYDAKLARAYDEAKRKR
ncbi:MAG: N-acetylmuramidase family protein [Deltaproteobacteria bacterium]|nr:N-acetylmuramidase family protein [Deltaproteobacteria bacterium]